MRNLFFALVLANLAFAAWQAWFAAEAPVREPPADADMSAIRLIAEVGPDEALPRPGARSAAADPAGGAGPAAGPQSLDLGTALRPEAATVEVPDLDLAVRIPPPSPVEVRCVGIGPFSERDDADGAADRLRASGLDPAPRAAEGDVGTSYWVHLDAIPTRAEANEMLSTLRENGVDDAYLIPGEEDGDIISLGVFNDVVRANRLRDQIRPIGFDPLVVDRPRRGTVYWVDVTLPAGRRLDFEALQTPGRIMRLEQRPCAAPGA